MNKYIKNIFKNLEIDKKIQDAKKQLAICLYICSIIVVIINAVSEYYEQDKLVTLN